MLFTEKREKGKSQNKPGSKAKQANRNKHEQKRKLNI